MFRFDMSLWDLNRIQKFHNTGSFQDMLRKNPPRFARIQYDLLDAFLERSLFDQNDEWPIRSNVIPNELITSLL